MYMQPVMMQQPVMMMQPQMMMAPQPQAPSITINVNKDENEFNCPKCKNGNLLETRKFTFMTCLICMAFPCALCLCADCAYTNKMVCSNPSCGYEESI